MNTIIPKLVRNFQLSLIFSRNDGIVIRTSHHFPSPNEQILVAGIWGTGLQATLGSKTTLHRNVGTVTWFMDNIIHKLVDY